MPAVGWSCRCRCVRGALTSQMSMQIGNELGIVHAGGAVPAVAGAAAVIKNAKLAKF